MRIFTQEIIVAPQHIDIQNRVSNLCYVQWMQDLAINHSTVQGWGVERYEAEGHGWVVRQHTITYKRPALAGDVITAATWVAELASRQSLRRYLFWRAADRSVLAEAATVWVYIDMATGRPSRLPASLQSAFEVVADDKEVLQSSCRASRHKRQVCLFSVYFPRSPVHDRAGQTAARRAAKENWRPSAISGGQVAKKGGRRISLPL